MLKNLSRIFTLSLLILFLITGCSNQPEKDESIETIKFSFEDNNLSCDDVFKETEFTPLETNNESLISKISQVIIADEKIFILDCKQNSLFVFNSNGKFLNKIGRIGHGSGEYIRPRYFFVNKKEATIKVFDAPTKKLICYSYTGKFIDEIKLNNYLRAVGEIKNGYWGFCPNNMNDNVDKQESKYIKFLST